jgi:hypothetical protein
MLVEHDRPTLSNLGGYRPIAANDPQEPGLLADPHMRGETPTWPGIDERHRRAVERGQAPSGHVSATAFGISLGANMVLLISVVALLGLLLTHAGASGLPSSSGGSQSGLGLTSTTPTPTRVASPTSGVSQLQVTPSSVQLSCFGDQSSQSVTLQNNGPETVAWQASFSPSYRQAGITLDPRQGELAPGDNQTLQIQNATSSLKGSRSVQGVVSFALTTQDGGQNAGPPASLSYTAAGCH